VRKTKKKSQLRQSLSRENEFVVSGIFMARGDFTLTSMSCRSSAYLANQFSLLELNLYMLVWLSQG